MPPQSSLQTRHLDDARPAAVTHQIRLGHHARKALGKRGARAHARSDYHAVAGEHALGPIGPAHAHALFADRGARSVEQHLDGLALPVKHLAERDPKE